VIDPPFRTPEDLSRLRPLEPDVDLAHVLETVRILTRELDVPLIGFAGAPFTLASYLIEGGPSRTFGRTKALMYGEPELWHQILDRLADIALATLKAEVEAGASAVQLFDSWVGVLSAADYASFVLAASRKVLEGVADLGVPRIHFGVGTGELLGLMSEAGADVVGVDWRVPLSVARGRIGAGKAVQGNLDPAICLAPVGAVIEETTKILADAGDQPGHIFNLGHGVLPETDPGVLARVVETVHDWKPAGLQSEAAG
jgi:uroporphyrinogen decarboxylase